MFLFISYIQKYCRVLFNCKVYSFQPHYDPGLDSASNRNEYQESSWG
jgi:hypothetical protein